MRIRSYILLAEAQPLSQSNADNLTFGQEVEQLAGQQLGSFFGHMMSTVDAAPAQIIGPRLPDAKDISVQSFKIVAERPQA
jgi:hypothetical protein